MADTVFKTEEFALYDGTEVTLSPLPIARLRKFMASWERASKLDDTDDGYDVLIDCAGIALAHNFKEKFESLWPTGDEIAALKKDDEKPVLSKEYREYLLDTLETPTINRIMKVVAGIDFDDPKLIQAMMEARLGQSSTS